MFWNISKAQKLTAHGDVITDSLRGELITSSGTAHVKGSYTEITQGTGISGDSHGFWMHLGHAGNVFNGLFDIAYGQASADQIIVPDLLISGLHTQKRQWIWIPLFVPGGERLYARFQSTTTSETIRLAIYTVRNGFNFTPVYSKVTGYGVVTGSSTGTSVSPSGTSRTWGSWAQLVASTSREIRHLQIAWSAPTNVGSNTVANIELGRGAAASEVAILERLTGQSRSNSEFSPPTLHYDLHIPSGSRLSARANSDNTGVVDEQEIALYGYE